mgnify:FL=1
MDAWGTIFNALSGLIIIPIVGLLKKNIPFLTDQWTVIVTGLFGVAFALVLKQFHMVVFADQTSWQTMVQGLGVNQFFSQLGWEIAKPKAVTPPA